MHGTDRQQAFAILVVTWLGGVVFLLTGVYVVGSLDGPERLAGAAMAVMGAVCLALGVTYGLGGLRPQRAPAERRPTPAPMIGSVTYRRSAKGYTDVIAGVGAAAFITLLLLFALAMVASGEGELAPILIVAVPMWLLITPATVQGLVRLVRDQAVLELRADGLRIPDVGWIPWGDIERLEIEDTRAIVADPGTTVVGSTRQLAIHLRDGAQPPRGNALDRALRRVGQGFLALGAAAGKGRYHWLAVPERSLDVPLEEVLDVASVYHARVVGLAAYEPASVAVVAPVPAAAPAAGTLPAAAFPVRADHALAASPDPVLAAEAAALIAADSGLSRGREHPPSRRVRWGATLVGASSVVVIATFFGMQMLSPWTLLGGIPWPFIAFGALVGVLRFAHRAAARRRAWTARPLAAMVMLTVVGFIGGVFGTSAAVNGPPTDASAGSPAPVAAQPPETRLRASGQTLDGAPELAIDGDPGTVWNAGAYPPGWIELDLGAESEVSAIRLLVEQSPAGPTVHHVHVASDSGAYEFVHSFDGATRSGQWLTYAPDVPLTAVRRVVIETASSPSWVAWREIVVERP